MESGDNGVSMAHQVFFSHATEDREAALRICGFLEEAGVSCWIAPRDVRAGTDYAAAILEGIRSSDLVLLIFSSFANGSPYVLREIERATAYGRPVLSIRVDDAVPRASMEYHVNKWLEARGNVGDKQKEIIAAVRGQLAGDETGRTRPRTRRVPANLLGRSRRARWIVLASVLLIVAAAAGGTWAAMHTRGHPASAISAQGHNVWTTLSPSTAPSARYGHDMVRDSSSGRILLFGGITGLNILDASNDTWAYDPGANTWTNLRPSEPLPPPRFAHVMEYDPFTKRVILFGGRRASTRLNDTWAYDPATNTWTDLNPAGPVPPAREASDMVYDPSSGRLIMFGGLSGTGDLLNDTWAYDPVASTWTNLNPAGTLPPARCLHSMAYDPGTHRVLLFGGWSASADPSGVVGDMWAYDPAANTWTEISPAGTVPSPRYSSLVYDSSNGLMILSGGGHEETWAYDPAANTWTEFSPVGTVPSVRLQQSMVFDPSAGRVIMFGGATQSSVLGDTWAYSL